MLKLDETTKVKLICPYCQNARWIRIRNLNNGVNMVKCAPERCDTLDVCGRWFVADMNIVVEAQIFTVQEGEPKAGVELRRI